jgi:hypothetical protein
MDITSWTIFVCFDQLNLINFLKNPTNSENLEHMQSTCNKIILVTKFEKLAYILQNSGCEWNSWGIFLGSKHDEIYEKVVL